MSLSAGKTSEAKSSDAKSEKRKKSLSEQAAVSKEANPLWQSLATGLVQTKPTPASRTGGAGDPGGGAGKSAGSKAPLIQRMCTECEDELPQHNTVAPVQASLTIGAPDDPYEKEADAVAAQVTRKSLNSSPPGLTSHTPSPMLQLACGECATRPEMLQRKDAGQSSEGGGLGSVQQVVNSPGVGSALHPDVRAQVEPVLGADLSAVRVHSDERAQKAASDIHAKAFTNKNNIYLARGQRDDDIALMAHEATHVVQQGAARRKATDRPEIEEAQNNTNSPRVQATPADTSQPVAGMLMADISADKSDAVEAAESTAQTSSEIEQSPGEQKHTSVQPSSTDQHTENHQSEKAASTDHAVKDQTVTEHTSDTTHKSDTTEADHAVSDQQHVEHEGLEKTAPADAGHEEHVAHDDHSPATSEESHAGGLLDALQIQGGAPAEAGDLAESAESQPEMPTPIEALENDSSAGPLVQRASFGESVGGFFRSIGSAVVSAGSSLAEGVSSRITGFVSRLRSGWNSLSSFGLGIYNSLASRFGGLLSSLGGFASGVVSSISAGWSVLRERVGSIAQSIRERLGAAIAPVFNLANRLVSAVAMVDGEALSSAWQSLTGTLGSIYDWLTGAVRSVGQRITGLWDGLRSRFSAFTRSLATRALGIFTQAHAAASRLGGRLRSLWQGVRSRASGLSSFVGGLASRFRPILGGIISHGRSLWNGIKSGWSSLSRRVVGVFARIRTRISSTWNNIRRRISRFRDRIAGYWHRLKQWTGRILQRLINGVRLLWRRFRQFAGRVMGVVRKLISLDRVYRYLSQIANDLSGFLAPITEKVTNKVYGAMPGSATRFAQEQFASAGATPASAETSSSSGSDAVVQRTPTPSVTRTTASWSDIGNGFINAILNMWNQLSWSVFFDMVKKVLLEQLFPIIAIYEQVRDFFVVDMYNLFSNMFVPRNLFIDPLSCLHDLWTNIYHFFADLVMSMLHRIINVLMSLMLWITIVLTLIGFIGGGVAVGVLGGILGGLFGLGVGAGPGAAGGAAAGGAAGAGVGFGVAMLVNEVIFFAFLAVQGTQILVTLIDLKTTRQSDAEKNRDYTQLGVSAVAVGVGLALLALAWLAGVVAKGVAALLRRLNLRINTPVPPALSRFGRGAGSVQTPAAGAPPPEAVAAALAAEQRLAVQVGGALARELVGKLGSQLAERLVENLGPAVAARLTSEQVDRLASLTAQQVLNLSRLGDSGFTRIINLPEAQLNRFAVLGEAQLRAFAAMDQAAFTRFANLSAIEFAKFQTMNPTALARFAALSDSAFARFAALDAATLAKFEPLNGAALARFGVISDAAFARFSALDAAALRKFSNVPQASLERFATMDAARFNILAQAEQATIEHFAALSDATFNRFSPVAYTVEELNKLGQLHTAVLDNLARMGNNGHFIFVTKVLDLPTLVRLGQLNSAEIDALVARVGTNPPRLTNMAALDVASIRNFLGIGDDALLRRFAGLPPAEIVGFTGLTSAELEQFALVAAGNLAKFGRLGNPASLRRFAALAPDQIAIFGRLTEPQLSVWASVDAATLAHFGGRDLLTLGKLADGAGVAGINRLAGLPPNFVKEFTLLSPTAMQRYLALPADQLAKFESMTAFNMEQMAALSPGELEARAATRTEAELLAEAGDTAANRAANRANVFALDNPIINPLTGRPKGHASDHSAATAPVPGGGMSPTEVRLRTGVTPTGHVADIPPDVGVFASDAAQLEAVRLGQVDLQAQIDAGNPIGTGLNGRHDFTITMEGVGYSYHIEGGAVDLGTGHIVGGHLVQQQAGRFIIVFEPVVAAPTTIGDYFIVTMFPIL